VFHYLPPTSCQILSVTHFGLVISGKEFIRLANLTPVGGLRVFSTSLRDFIFIFLSGLALQFATPTLVSQFGSRRE